MLRQTFLSAAALLGLLGATTANAAVFDFLAAGNAKEAGYKPYTLTNGGLTVTASGFNGANQVFAYLDGGNAGLGVCKAITSALQCAPSYDDNVTSGERLNLTFASLVNLTNTSFRGDGHGSTFRADKFVSISIDGGAYSSVMLPPTNGQYNTVLTGKSFDFKYGNEQFYISSVTASVVPEPASALLLGIGMMGLVAARRRRV